MQAKHMLHPARLLRPAQTPSLPLTQLTRSLAADRMAPSYSRDHIAPRPAWRRERRCVSLQRDVRSRSPGKNKWLAG